MNDNTLNAMFSSKTDEWATPISFFNEINKSFNFNLDVCALDESAKCDRYYTEEIDGLTQEWNGMVWMNPPYSDIKNWIQKAYEESLKGSTVAALIPARTDTQYWHNYCMNAEEIMFIKGRLKFGNSNNSAPFPSALVIFHQNHTDMPIMSTYDQSIGNVNYIRNTPVLYFNNVNPLKFIY